MAERHLRILDPRLFWRKLALLLLFSALFLPLKYYERRQEMVAYVIFLLLLHVYFVFILVWRVRWRILSEHRRSFLLRMLAVALFIYLLVLASGSQGVTFAEFAAFLGVSLVIHTALLLSLTVVWRPIDPLVAPAKTEA